MPTVFSNSGEDVLKRTVDLSGQDVGCPDDDQQIEEVFEIEKCVTWIRVRNWIM